MNHKQRTNLLEEALSLHQAHQHDEAELIYAKVRRECPKDFDAWYLSGAMAFQRGGHLEEAVELLQKARKLNADSAHLRNHSHHSYGQQVCPDRRNARVLS
jgi:tetratricopeptide (TPR) repeat protein